MTEDQVADYLRELRGTPLLSQEQEVFLARAIEAGLYAAHLTAQRRRPGEEEDLRVLVVLGEEATHVLIRSNLRLVVLWRSSYRSGPVDAGPALIWSGTRERRWLFSR